MQEYYRVLAEIKNATDEGRLVEARRLARYACEQWPAEAESWLWQAWLCEDPKQALVAAREAVQLAPGPVTEQAVEWARQRVAEQAAARSARRTFFLFGPSSASPGGDRAGGWSRRRLLAWIGAILLFVLGTQLGTVLSQPDAARGSEFDSEPGVSTDHQASLAGGSQVVDPAITPPPLLTGPGEHTGLPPSTPIPPDVATDESVLAQPDLWTAPAEEEVAPAAEGSPPPLLPTLEPGAGNERPPEGMLPTATPLPTRPEDPRYALWPARVDPVPYTVQPGDSIRDIAKRFYLQPTSLIWTNEEVERNSEMLNIGQVILIPPLDGVLHTVKEGDTLESIAATYGVDAGVIAWFPGNRLPGDNAPLQAGEKILVPGGRKPYTPPPPPPTPPPSQRNQAGYFGWPAGGYITQSFGRYHGGIDIAGPMNSPIFAAQDGEVVISGWDTTGYGYNIVIDHHNGWYTRYAHLSGMHVKVGDWVERGEVIARMGSTGRSTGPHVHFEVMTRGYRYNPMEYLPR